LSCYICVTSMFLVCFIPRVVFRPMLVDAVPVVAAALRAECGSRTEDPGNVASQSEMGLEHRPVCV
jgi:hypothetical protein